jgi:hypothetical protein
MPQDDMFGRFAQQAMAKMNAPGMYDALARLELQVAEFSCSHFHSTFSLPSSTQACDGSGQLIVGGLAGWRHAFRDLLGPW